MIANENFLVLGEDWGFYPSTTEHLLRRLVGRNRFLWVDAIGCRAPQWNLYTLRRAWGKALRWASTEVRSPARDGVVLYSPPVLPLRRQREQQQRQQMTGRATALAGPGAHGLRNVR